VRAVNNVSFDIKRNTVHCLVGENGAGKSTLIKILTGAYTRTSGRIHLNGQEYSPHSTRDAKQKGISTLFQELNVVDQLTVEENLTLGMEDTTFGFLRRTDKINKMVSVMNSIEPSIKPRQLVSTLSVAKKQIVEIAKAVAAESNIIIMDEPTAAISESEIARLFTIIKSLRENNVTVIYISTARRDFRDRRLCDGDAGRHAHRHQARGADPRPVRADQDDDRQDRVRAVHTAESRCEDILLQAKHLTNHRLSDISFDIHAGEIVGFYGLVGAGKTSWPAPSTASTNTRARSCSRARNSSPRQTRPSRRHHAGARGKTLPGTVHHSDHPRQCARHEHGQNLPRRVHRRRRGADRSRGVRRQAEDRHQQHEKEAAKLSGGNQQKVVLAKCLFADADLLMLDEPTRGIDVGQERDLHLIRQLSKEGKTIMIFSSNCRRS